MANSNQNTPQIAKFVSEPIEISTRPPQTPTEFHFFSKLPLEIRLRIYTLSLPGPRLIPLIYNAPITPSPLTPHHEHEKRYQPRYLSPYPPLSPSRTPVKHSTITSPNLPPLSPLFHVNFEARAHMYTLYIACLPLSGLSASQAQKQILYNPAIDILFLPSRAGYNASFNNFTAIHTLTSPAALRGIRRLAVSEAVFLEEEKSRWRRTQITLGTGADVDIESEKGDDVRGGRIDGVTGKNLGIFWDVVMRKFTCVEEVWILGGGMEGQGQIPGEDIERCGGSDVSGSLESFDDEREVRLLRKRRLSFQVKVERAVRTLEEESGWIAPRWRIVGCQDEEGKVLFSGGRGGPTSVKR
ncbi:hypothetical protein WAI453_001325 [Rhynchosporium graminicola]